MRRHSRRLRQTGGVPPLDDRAARDQDAGFEVLESFERFSQVDDVFSRSFWDETIRDDKTDRFYATYRRPLAEWRRAKGFTQRDYAVRNASWHVADIFAELHEQDDRRDGFLDDLAGLLRAGPARADGVECDDPVENAAHLKRVATTFGADLIGVTAYDERWIYTERFSASTGAAKPNDLDPGLDHVVVVGQAMDRDLIRTAPSALAGSATGLGYSQDALVLLAVSQYIVNLGYRAVPSMNDSALAVPFAVQAGLGEYGRHGMVITPEFGTSLRLGKIFTDLPLAHDRPRSFGVKEFCQECDRCAAACPARAIGAGEPVPVALNRSGITGVRKWSVDGEACFGYWSKINSDCAICVRVCPWTRDYTKRRNRWWRAAAGTRLRGAMLSLDDRLDRPKRLKASHWWAGEPSAGRPGSQIRAAARSLLERRRRPGAS